MKTIVCCRSKVQYTALLHNLNSAALIILEYGHRLGRGEAVSLGAKMVVAQEEEGVSTQLLVGAGGTKTDSWSMSFAPRLEPVASRRVSQHSA